MAENESRIRVSARVYDGVQRDRAKQIFESDADIHLYDGLVTGFATRETIIKLMEAGFFVDQSSSQKSDPPPLLPSADLPGLTSALDAPLEAMVSELVEKSKWAKDALAATGSTGSLTAMVDRASVTTSSFLLGALSGWLRRPVMLPETVMYEAQLVGPMRPEWLGKLRDIRAPIISYAPPYRYRLPLTNSQLERVQTLEFVHSVERYGLRSVLGRRFLEALNKARGTDSQQSSSKKMALDLEVHVSTQASPIKRLIARHSGTVVLDASGPYIRFLAAITDPFVVALADREEVKSLDVYTPPMLMLEFCRSIIGVETINAGTDVPWDGAGEIVGVIDSGVDSSHPDLSGSIKSYQQVSGATATDKDGHGTHVAGIIVGSGKASSGKIKGVAPGATLSVVGIVDENGQPIFPADLTDYIKRATTDNAKVVNMSVGCGGTNGSYGPYAQSLDTFVYENPEVLIVVASGNDGTANQGYPDYQTVATPATGNNVIAVGACSTTRTGISQNWGAYNTGRFPSPPVSLMEMAGPNLAPAAISSRGPTASRTMKPDVLAPGTFVLSAQASNSVQVSQAAVPGGTGPYIFLHGSSMAAPFVSASAAILRQYLRQQMNMPKPSAALLKAMLCASAVRCPPIVNPAFAVGYPDFDQGFGIVNIARLIPHVKGDQLRMTVVDVANNSADALLSRQPPESPRRSTRSYTLQVADKAEFLQVVLAWTDTPGAGGKKVLWRDVQGQGGALVGNHEVAYARAGLFNRKGLNGIPYDTENNIQVVYVSKPPAGEYRVNILAHDTPDMTKPQGYGLCACGDLMSELKPVQPLF